MGKKNKIVIIDDNTDFLFTMATFLLRNGFDVMTADNGQKGIELIRKERPNLVLLDIMMETLFSGFEVFKRMRSDKSLRNIPIIGISAMRDALDIDYRQWPDYEYFSPDTFLDKPVDRQRLLRMIPEVIRRAKKRIRRPKWQQKRDQEWAKKASQSL